MFLGVDFKSKITRAEFEDLCDDIFRRCMDSVERALRDANLDKSEIHDVLLVGGSTRIPKVQKMLRQFMNGKDLCRSVNLEEAAAYGAAVHAAILTGIQHESIWDLLEVEVTPFSLGIEQSSGVMQVLVKRNMRIPSMYL